MNLREYLIQPTAPRAHEDQWMIIGSSIAEDAPENWPGLQDHLVRRNARLGALKNACSRGDLKACSRLLELELLFYTHHIHPRLGGDQSFLLEGPFDLCARGAAEACFASTFPGRRDMYGRPRIGDVPELLRGCELGSALSCANAAYRLRGDARAPALYGRACAGGIRWACEAR